MRLRIFLLTAFTLFHQSALGAYVQIRQCGGLKHGDNSTDAFGLSVEGLRASIDVQRDGNSRLALTVSSRHPRRILCEDVRKHQYTSTLQMEALGRTSVYEGRSGRLECVQQEPQPALARHTFIYNIADPYPLAAYDLTMELQDEDAILPTCVEAPLTPDVGNLTTQIVTWVPIIVFIVVSLAAVLPDTTSLCIEQEDENHLAGDSLDAAHSRIAQIADCISYLQFIFFSSALSIRYPGFIQPLASRTSWSTLMFPNGVVIQESWYEGVQDGLYEVNGTFGGTYGMELMTQVMGGTVTTDTWINTMALAAIAFALFSGIMLCGERLVWTRDWFQASYSLEFRDGSQIGARATTWRILRLFCSYFLLPLVAWTTHQLSHAAWHPVYHTVAATTVICSTMVLVWWAMSQSSARSLGYLLVRASKSPGNTLGHVDMQNMHATGFFVLLILRGLAIGGLQMVGMTQLLIMIALETVQVALRGAVYQTSRSWSRTELLAMIRLMILVLQTSFLPDVAELTTKMIVGYVIVAIHATVLAALFFLPAVLGIVGLVRVSVVTRLFEHYGNVDENLRPQIYGLRQLARRPTNSPTQPALDASSPAASHTSLPAFPGSDQDMSHNDRYCFRHPPSSLSLHALLPMNPGAQGTLADETMSEGSSTSSKEISKEGTEAEYGPLPNPSPLDPSVDYAFREIDLYYVRPRRPSFHHADNSPAPTLKDRILSSFSGR